MQIQEPILNHKTFNMFTSTLVKNQIPHIIQLFKLQTHHDLILNNKLYRYVTNIILASHHWIKLFVMFQKNHTYQIYENDIMENIRSIGQIQRNLLVEVDYKIFCLGYQQGNLKTISMIALEFIRLRQGYRSFVKIDNTKKYTLMIAGDYLIIMVSAKCKDSQLLILNDMPIFQKAADQVKWYHPDHNYFNTIYYTKIIKPYFRQIMDVQIDKSGIYLLVQEGGDGWIYSMNFAILRPEDTPDTIFKRKIQVPQQSYKMTIMSPENDSSLLLFTSKIIYHYFFTSSFSQQKSPIIAQLPLSETTDLSTLRVRWFNPNNVYYKDNQGIYVVKVVGDKLQRTIINNIITRDFSMTTASINGCLVYLSEGKCVVETFQGSKCIYMWLNSLIDFHIGRSILCIQYQGDRFLKSGKENNRVISIKRSFRPIDKITSNPKKSFIEGLMPFQAIHSIGDTKLLIIKTGKQKLLYKDGETITRVQLKDIEEVYDVKIDGASCLIALSQGKLTQYDSNFQIIWQIDNQNGRMFSCNGGLFVIQHKGQLTVINFHTKKSTKFKQLLPDGTLQIYITKQQYSFTRRNLNQPNPYQQTRYLLHSCTKNDFYIHILKPQSQEMILVWKTAKVASGLVFLNNVLGKSKINENELDEYRSISDPHYVINNLIQPTPPTESKYHIVDFKYIQLTSQTVIMFLNSNNQCFLYKQLLAQTSIGILYKKVVLPLYTPRSFDEAPFVEYTSELVRFGTRLIYDDIIMDIAEPFKHCFVLGGELWLIGNDNRMRLADIKGTKIQGKLVQTIAQNNSYHSIQNSPEYYALFTRQTIQLYDKDLAYKNKISIKSAKSIHTSNQEILMAKIFQSHCAISSYQYFKSSTQNFQSYKFLFSVYDIKDKTRTDPLILQQPPISIKFSRPGRVVFATSSQVSICQIKSNKLQTLKTISYSLRGYLGNMSYWKQSKQSNTSFLHFMVFGGAIDGLSFAGFDDQRLFFKQKWFEPLPFGIRDIQIFVYGTSLKALITDNDKNVIVMDLKEDGSTKIADLHLGTLVNKLIKVQDSTRNSDLVYACCADGTIRVFTAIKRIGTTSLRKFQKLIYQQLPTIGGLTLQYRRLKQENRSYKVGCRGDMVELSTLELFQSVTQELRDSIIQKSQYQEEDIQALIAKNCIF